MILKVPSKEVFLTVKPSRIALVGHAGSGKDYIASLLPGFQRVAFGDPIRYVVMVIRGGYLPLATTMLEQLSGGQISRTALRSVVGRIAALPRESAKDRLALQELGTTINRILGGVWVSAGLKKASSLDRVVFTDVRRVMEFEKLQEAGYLMVGVYVGEGTRFSRLNERDGVSLKEFESMLEHPAEKEINTLIARCDKVLTNDPYITGSLCLQKEIENLLIGEEVKRCR